MRCCPFLLFVLLSVYGPSLAQQPDSLTQNGAIGGTVELGGFVSNTGQTPFWLRANQYGTVPLGGTAGLARASVFRDYKAIPAPDSGAKKRPPRFDWGFGLAVAAHIGPTDRPNYAVNDAGQVLWPEVYAKVRFGAFELFGGRRREVYGLGDTTLTSGFVAWSGNSIPFPKIQLHTPDFVPIRWLWNAVAFRAGYAHGWFTTPFVQNALFHQKYLYIRLGKPNSRLKLTGGLNHQAVWGGRADYLIGTGQTITGQLPDTFRDYLSVVLANYPDDVANERYTEFDGTNRIGNHIGSIDFSAAWTDDRRSWLLYHQHIYEDASGVAFQNFPDGLSGLRWLSRKRPTRAVLQLRRVVLEFLYTINQSGDIFNQSLRYQGRDNYFNHGQYTAGWSYQSRTIGTPFLAQNPLFTPDVNRQIGGGVFSNNRLLMWYLGAEALLLQRIRLTGRLAWSRNFGSYNEPYSPVYEQVSALLTGQGQLPRLPNIWLTASVAVDQGRLYPNAVGGFVSLQKRW
jgi:hypothetical protein